MNTHRPLLMISFIGVLYAAACSGEFSSSGDPDGTSDSDPADINGDLEDATSDDVNADADAGDPDAGSDPSDTPVDPAADLEDDHETDGAADPISDDPCSGVTCGEHAYCEEGVCVCEEGYVKVGDVCVDPDSPGHIMVRVNGDVYFNHDTDRSLIARGLHFTTDQYRDGPPGAEFTVVSEDIGGGHLEVIATGMDDDHHNCQEKWGFIILAGDCAEVMLEKWNWNECNDEYYTDRMKLETWIDLNGDCDYQGLENDEPYSDMGIHWSPEVTYTIVFDWS